MGRKTKRVAAAYGWALLVDPQAFSEARSSLEATLTAPIDEAAFECILEHTRQLYSEFILEHNAPRISDVRAELECIQRLSDNLFEKLKPLPYGKHFEPHFEPFDFQRHFRILNAALFDLGAHEILAEVSKRSREALGALKNLRSEANVGPQPGDAWRRAVQSISRDFDNLHLPTGVGKGFQHKPSKFVRFIDEWQNLLLPPAARRATHSLSALASEIHRARGRKTFAPDEMDPQLG